MAARKKSTGIFETVSSHIYVVDMKNTTKRRRRYLNRLKKRSSFCMLLLALLVVTGITLQLVKLCEIRAAQDSIRAIYDDTVLLKSKIDNTRVEFELETREAVICQMASKTLGMIEPEDAYLIVLPTSFDTGENMQLASAGVQN